MTFEGFDRKTLVIQRLTAYIHPKRPVTEAQKKAFDDAVTIQAEYEEANEAQMDELPANAESFSIGHYSVSLRQTVSEYTRDSLHPAAWALLHNTGLIPGSIPRARRV